MDISRIFKALFTVLLMITFMLLIVSAYQRYRESAKLAALGDATSSIATKLALDELAFEDRTGRHAYVVDPMKFMGVENFACTLGGDNYEFYCELRYRGEGEVVLGPRGATLPEGRTSVSLALAVAVHENARLLEGRLKVVAWRA